MPYLGSLVVALAALLVLAALVLTARGPLRRFGARSTATREDLGERFALLGARVGALRARRAGGPRPGRVLAEAPTIETARSDRGSIP